MVGCQPLLHVGKQLRQVFLKDLWTREIAGGPIIDEGQETVQLSDDPRNVFSVGNQETMEGILIISTYEADWPGNPRPLVYRTTLLPDCEAEVSEPR